MQKTRSFWDDNGKIPVVDRFTNENTTVDGLDILDHQKDGISTLEIMGQQQQQCNAKSAPPLKLQGRASSEPAACGHEINRHQSPFTTCYFLDAFSRLLQIGINKQCCYNYINLDLFMYIYIYSIMIIISVITINLYIYILSYIFPDSILYH